MVTITELEQKLINEVKSLLQLKDFTMSHDFTDHVKREFAHAMIEKYNQFHLEHTYDNNIRDLISGIYDFTEIEATIKEYFTDKTLSSKYYQILSNLHVDGERIDSREDILKLNWTFPTTDIPHYVYHIPIHKQFIKFSISRQWEFWNNFTQLVHLIYGIEIKMDYGEFNTKVKDYEPFTIEGFTITIYKNNKIKIMSKVHDLTKIYASFKEKFYGANPFQFPHVVIC